MNHIIYEEMNEEVNLKKFEREENYNCEKKSEIEVSDKDCVGYREVYWEFFKCPNCHNDNLINLYNFCPDCGYKVEWNL